MQLIQPAVDNNKIVCAQLIKCTQPTIVKQILKLIGGGTKGARGAMAPPDFRLMVLASPDFIQLVMVVFKHIPTILT